MNKKIATLLWVCFVFLIGLSAYVNWHYPHGEIYATGDISCEYNDRNCDLAYAEDLTDLNIPDWAKTIRRYGFLLILPLGVAATIMSVKRRE